MRPAILAAWLAAAALAAALVAAPASAAQFVLSTGAVVQSQPSVAIDRDGNAWVTWVAPFQGDYAIEVCEVPEGGAGCAPGTTQQLVNPGEAGATASQVRSYLSFDPASDTLWLLVSGTTQGTAATGLFEASSQFNGSSYPPFAPATTNWIGNLAPDTAGDVALDGADGLALAIDPGGDIVGGAAQAANVMVQSSPLGGSPSGQQATLVPDLSDAYRPVSSTIVSDGAGAVAAWDSGYVAGGAQTGGAVSYAYTGSSAPAAFDGASSWQLGTLDDGGLYPQLTSGPAGTFMVEGGLRGLPVAVRSFTGAGFGAPRDYLCGDPRVYGVGRNDYWALAQDPSSGRLALGYIATDSRRGDAVVRYVAIGRGGQSLPVTVASAPATDAGGGDWDFLQIATGAGRGLAIWGNFISGVVTAAWLPAPPLVPGACAAGAPPVTVSSPAVPVTGSVATVSLACAAATTCTGTVALSARVSGARFKIPADATRSVRVRLSAATLRLLIGHHSRRATVRIAAGGRTSSEHVTLVLSRRRHGRLRWGRRATSIRT